MSHSTDVCLACHCDQCHGAEAIVTACKNEVHLPAGIASSRAGRPRRSHRVPQGSQSVDN
jgi:hypothetical protein